MRYVLVAAVVGSAAFVSTAWARAETGRPVGESLTERKGFVVGLGIGVGIGHRTQFECTDCYRANQAFTGIHLVAPPQLQLGFMASRRLAVLMSVHGGVYFPPEDVTFKTLYLIAPTAQFFLNDRLWVKAGAGLAIDKPPLIEGLEKNESGSGGYGGIIAVGTSLIRRRQYTFDLEGRFLYASLDHVVTTYDQGSDLYWMGPVPQRFTRFETAFTFTHW